jgi:hypothetical protein
VSAVFLLTRLPYFIFYPVLTISNDSASYIAAAFELMDLNAPMFDIRTPGYPVFLSLIMSVTDDAIFISLIQSLFTYVAAIFFLSVSYKYYESVIFYFAIAVSAFISSAYFLVLEMSILTEGIFTSLMLILAGLFIIAVKSESIFSWSIYSVLVAMLILVRPAGLFLVGLFGLLILFFIINKYSLRYYIAAIVPFSIIIVALCTYNYATLGKFTVTPFGEANLAGVTVLFMETSEEYPDFVYKAIDSTLSSIPKKDLRYVRNSYNPDNLFTAFRDNFHMQMNLVNYMKMNDSSFTYIKAQPILRQISLDAISKHPNIYAKFFYSNFYYFLTNIGRTIDYKNELARKYKQVAIDKIYLSQLQSGKWSQISSRKEYNERVLSYYLQRIEEQKNLAGFSVDAGGNVTLQPSFLMSLYGAAKVIFDFLFRNLIWLLIFALMSFMSIRQCISSRLTDKDAFIALAFVLIFVLKAVMVSSIESSLERYSYTVDFVIYMSLPFAIIIYKNGKKTKILKEA